MADLVAEINDVLTYLAPEQGVKLELLRYEIDTYPDYGAPQEVVDRMIRDDSEIFVGMMWRRCGTPTKNQPSGTISEYRRAVARRKKTGRPIIMFYFCDAPVPFPTKGDIDQLKGVVKFRTELQPQSRTQTYPSPDRFREYVRGDLLGAVRDVLAAERPGKKQEKTVPSLVASATDEEVRTVRGFCLEYNQLRESMEPSPHRTRLMTAIFAKMRSHAASVVSSLADFKSGQTAGERLAAVAILQMFPLASELDWLAERLNPELEKPFLGYQAAQALLTAVQGLPKQDYPQLRKAVSTALRLAKLNKDDRPRIDTLELALELLNQTRRRIQ